MIISKPGDSSGFGSMFTVVESACDSPYASVTVRTIRYDPSLS